MIRTLLVANRGEIACRIARTCRDLGIRPVAVFTEEDRHSLHVRALGEAVRVDSYLDIEQLVAAACRCGAQALHPGYGFLAESPALARAVAAAGLIFVGPTPEAMEALGDKRMARQRCGLPVVPGGSLEEAGRLGFPLMIKAAHGGGGRGMRLVHRAEELEQALAAAQREAEAGFGSGELLLEKALERPRHIEVQIFGDRQGRVIALGERECSLQRRYQKLVEETPAPRLSAHLRQALLEGAVQAAQRVGYSGAGTVEFLLEGEQFYFLEMNARLQVEHPVTELVTGLDLVEWQLRVAQGEPLPEVRFPPHGHALEVRLCAEDPRTHLPSGGTVELFRPGPVARCDGAIESGDRVGIRYDSLLAKLIVRGESREQALRAMARALEETVLLGVTSNLELLRHLVEHPEFVRGELDTGFVARHPLPPREPPRAASLAAAVLTHAPGPGWRNQANPAPARQVRDEEGQLHLVTPEGSLEGDWLELEGHRQAAVVRGDWVYTRQETRRLEVLPWGPPAQGGGASGSLRTPMPGQVLAVLVEAGQAVVEGQALVRLEAMKMEHTVVAPRAGVVEEVHCRAGQQVGAQDLLIGLD